MIPSVNRQNANESDWPERDGGKWPQNLQEYESLNYVCDCCKKHVAHVVRHSMPTMGNPPHSWTDWSPEWNPRLVMVNGVTYYGCSSECARILFDIHHQYAMREV